MERSLGTLRPPGSGSPGTAPASIGAGAGHPSSTVQYLVGALLYTFPALRLKVGAGKMCIVRARQATSSSELERSWRCLILQLCVRNSLCVQLSVCATLCVQLCVPFQLCAQICVYSHVHNSVCATLCAQLHHTCGFDGARDIVLLCEAWVQLVQLMLPARLAPSTGLSLCCTPLCL